MKSLLFQKNDLPNKTLHNLLRVVILLLIVLILMNAGAFCVSLYRTVSNALAVIIVPLLLSIILAFILDPVVLFFERHGISRTFSICIIYIGIFFCIATLLRTIIPAIQDEIISLQKVYPQYSARFVRSIGEQEDFLKERYEMFKNLNITGSISSYLKEKVISQEKSELLITSSKFIGSFLSILVLVPFFTFFFLKDGSRMKKKVISLVPNRYFEMSLNLFYQIDRQLGGFIRARLLEAFAVGFICFAGLSILEIKYSFVLAIIAAIMNLIPYVGPFIGVVPALLIAFVDTGDWMIFFWVAFIYLLAQLFDMLIIIPSLFSRIVNMHPLVVIIVIIVGGQMGGILGMILAVPIYSIIKVTITEVHKGLSSLRI